MKTFYEYEVGDKVKLTRELLTEVRNGDKIEFKQPLREVIDDAIVVEVTNIKWDGKRMYIAQIDGEKFTSSAFDDKIIIRT